MKNIPFKIIMSRGDAIRIDTDELKRVLAAIRTGSPAMVRNGIFNPSFYVSIVKDDERLKDFHDEVLRLSKEDSMRLREAGPKPLTDLFADIRKLVETKRLT